MTYNLEQKREFIEIVLLYICIPLSLCFIDISSAFIVLMWFVGVFFIINMWTYLDLNFKLKSFVASHRRFIRMMVIRFFISSSLIIATTLIMHPETLFLLPLERPLVWLMVILSYPLISVVPQEVIFRVYFFRRYQNLFARRSTMIFMNGLLFGFAHIFFQHPIVMLISMVGGWMFAHTYCHSRSLLLVSIEHSLYGIMLFTVGMGQYFVNGSM